jgi:hypothetical protein
MESTRFELLQVLPQSSFYHKVIVVAKIWLQRLFVMVAFTHK